MLGFLKIAGFHPKPGGPRKIPHLYKISAHCKIHCTDVWRRVSLSVMDKFEPWLKYPSLTAGRLSLIAEIIRLTRAQTVNLYDPAAGERPWDLGCRVYSRVCSALRKAAENCDWLTVLEKSDSLRFAFAIGVVPIRFFHGDAETAPTHYLIATPAEAKQQALALKFEGLAIDDEVFRIAVETGSDQFVSSVTLVIMDGDGTAIEGYSIPMGVEPITSGLAAPLHVPPPIVVPLDPTSLPPSHEGDRLDAPPEIGDSSRPRQIGVNGQLLFPNDEAEKDANAGGK